MSQWAPDRYDFEHFPHQEVTVLLSRRQFWRALFTGVEVLREKHKGQPTFGLDMLGAMPDEEIGHMMPVVQAGVRISMIDGFVCASMPGAELLRLFPMDCPALSAFNQFNGMMTVTAISQNVADSIGWTAEYSAAYVRGLFLALVMRGVCAPANF